MEFKLIIKKLNKTLTPEEETIFSKWYNESNSHKDYFNSVKTNYKTDLDLIDVEKGWLVIQHNLKTRKQKYYWKYAIAASIVLLISINFIFNKKENTNIVEPTIVDNNTIKVGSDKATLTLEDGTHITLEKGQQYVSDNLESNGEEIIYKSKNKSKSEIVYNYLTIPRGGQYHITLSDGTEIWLNSESQLKYPTSFIEGENRMVELVYGEAYFDVSPSTNHKGSKFNVRHQNQNVEVLGTAFNIKAYNDETNIYTTLVEGEVAINYNGEKQNLTPNKQANINTLNGNITIYDVDVESIISWKNGLFTFKGKSLKDIMKVISRWYDIDVIFINKDLESLKFKGVLSKNQSVEEILAIMKSNTINDYEIKNKTIIIK